LAGSIRLPAGLHHLSITRAGFEPSELDVTVARGATFTTIVTLQPDAQTRDAYLAGIRARRIWGWSIGGLGVAALATGVVLLITGHSALDTANANLATVNQSFVMGGTCDFRYDVNQDACKAMFADAQQRVTDAKNRITAGYVVGGVGAAVVITGAVVLLTGDDPGKYDRKTASSSRPVLSGWTTGSGGGLTLIGRF
jgi:hypothetical protein